ncbi:MAG TPA: YdeI/OmpD-associated family protein [Vicinamibacterales bacterium]|nr:YdeI/OmpD-associated family protein [Vicinamibacterales bacterium]
MTKPTFFRTAAEFRRWLKAHGEQETEIWIGFHKLASGRSSMTYPEAVDEALCFGWIDGVRRSLDADSYVQRFTPRKKDSYWSRINLAKFAKLKDAGRVAAPGHAAFERRTDKKQARYSFENAPKTLSSKYIKTFKANRDAWRFYEAQPPGYRRVTTFYVMSAAKEETRERRLARLIADSAAGRRIGLLEKKKT